MAPRTPKYSAKEIATFDITYNQATKDYLDAFQTELGSNPQNCKLILTVAINNKERVFDFEGIHDQGYIDGIFSRFRDAHNNKGNDISSLMGNAGIENDPNVAY